jgi:uridine kinase
VDTPKHSDGSYNFESLDALDVNLFNDHILRLIQGERVETPIYSFTRGERVEKTAPMELGPRDVLITEGIHCLNPRLTEGIGKRRTFGIYVSALTQLSIDDHSRIFTADVRMLRRIVRDRLFRNYSAEQTLIGWKSVRSGENKYIFPYQENADSMFNSALVYEPAVIRTYAERFLLEVPLESPAMAEAYRLLRFLHLLVPLFPEEVPQNSLLREFIGGSAFTY